MLNQDVIEKMQYIVDNCQGEENPACVAACPMHTNAKEYIRLIAEGKGDEAIKVIRENLFLPGTLGRICAHPCEGKCKWNEGRSPMSIASLKRYAADNFDLKENWDLDIKESSGKHVSIIGSGPSGMQAALELRRQGHEVTVYDKLPVRGGMLRVGIPSYRLPAKVLENEISYLDLLGINFKLNTEVGKDISFEEIKEKSDAVVIAIGKHLGRVDRSLENHDAKGVFSAASFLRETELNDKVKNLGKTVLVVGGGDVAMDCARTALRSKGVERVYDACLEDSFASMFAAPHEIQGAIDEGVKFNNGQGIAKIFKNDENSVNFVRLKKCLSMFDENGRFSPKFDEELTYDLEVDTIIFAIGQGVDAPFAEDLKRNPNGTFACDSLTLQSPSDEKVFIAGDVSGESVIAVQAMATGRRASQSINRFLEGKDLKENRDIKETSGYDTKLDMPTDWSLIEGKRLNMAELPVEERLDNFNEVYLGFTKEEAKKEALRCRQCECKLCMKECIMLKDFTDCPKTLFKEYLEKGYENVDKMIAYSCNECSQCTLECPKSLDLRSNFIALKESYARDNNGLTVLPVLQESDKTQILESSDKYCIKVEAPEKEILLPNKEINIIKKKKKTKYVFAPGCSVSAYNPYNLEMLLLHLKDSLGEENTGALLQCCGKVTKFLGEEEKFYERNKKATDILDEMGAEVIITVCPSCFNVFKDTAKNQKTISYWDLCHDLIGIPERAKDIGKDSDIVFNIHDSCVTRNEISHHESVRWMLDEMGYNWTEIERSGSYTRCCGVGGMVCSSDPSLYKKVYERRAKDFTEDHIVTYCGSCRSTFEAAGLDAVHILDLLYGPKYMKGMEEKRSYTSEDEMWKNRLETKERFKKYI